MKLHGLLALAGIFALSTGCATRPPSVTHAHIGHCLTHWHDTPENKGLLDVARQELDTAVNESDAAIAAGLSPADKARHIENVAHALNPDVQPVGPGFDYGAVRALEGAIEHLEYAATSEDASLNIVSSVAVLSELGLAIAERLKSAVALAGTADERERAALDKAAIDLRSALHFAARGLDANGNGRIDPVTAEAGIDQLQTELQAMLNRETNPAYEPLPRKYVLGLVKLPNGKWSFASLRGAKSRPTYGY